jgi:hypothetical protein
MASDEPIAPSTRACPSLDEIRQALPHVVTIRNATMMTTKSTLTALQLHFGLDNRHAFDAIREEVKAIAKAHANALMDGSQNLQHENAAEASPEATNTPIVKPAEPPTGSDAARVLECLRIASQRAAAEQKPDLAWLPPASIVATVAFPGGKPQVNKALYALHAAKLADKRSDGPNNSKPKWRAL